MTELAADEEIRSAWWEPVVCVVSDIANSARSDALSVDAAVLDSFFGLKDGYYMNSRRLVEKYSGRFENVTGDGLLATFYDKSPDASVRALKYAIELIRLGRRKLVPVLEQISANEMVLTGTRVGIARGTIIAGLVDNWRLIKGDIVNLSARLEANAPIDGVLMTQSTYVRILMHEPELVTKAVRKVIPVEKLKGQDRDVVAWEIVEDAA